MIFLLNYDRATRSLLTIEAYGDRETASRAKVELEISMLGSARTNEIVILEAEDEASLRETHSRYFSSLVEMQQTSSELGASRKGLTKYWTVRLDKRGWHVQAEGVPEAHYGSKEQAYAAAAKDAKDWFRATGNATGVRLWTDDGDVVKEEVFTRPMQ